MPIGSVFVLIAGLLPLLSTALTSSYNPVGTGSFSASPSNSCNGTVSSLRATGSSVSGRPTSNNHVTTSTSRPSSHHCNGTISSPTGTGISASGGLSCSTNVTTAITTTTSTIFASAVTTQVVASDAHSINGEDCPPYCGYRTVGSTITYIDYITTTVDQTTTETTTTTPTTRVGTNVTVTAPVPPGFVPVQSSLPRATYLDRYKALDPVTPARRRDLGRRASLPDPCSPKTSTLTKFLTTTPTVTQSLGAGGGLVWVFYSTLVDGSTYTYPSPIYTIITATTTAYAVTITETLTANTTTILPVTKTSYAACATNNWADAIVLEDGSTSPIRRTNGGELVWYLGPGPFSPSECCAAAIENSAPSWSYYTDGNTTGSATEKVLCVHLSTLEPVNCSQTANTDGVLYGPLDQPRGELIVGNAYCGLLNSEGPDPNASTATASPTPTS